MTSAPLSKPTVHRIPVGTLDLAATTYGETGPPLILLHGLGSRGVSWWPVIDALAVHFRLIVPDLRGHGDSDKPSSGYALTDFAADLDGLIAQLDLDQPAIIGHSLGAVITMIWASTHPDAASRIVLEDPPLQSDPAIAGRFAEWSALARFSVSDAAAYYRHTYPDWTDADCLRRAESITSTAPAVFSELHDQTLADATTDRVAPLAAVRSPILVIHGDPEAGSMVAPTDLIHLRASVPGAETIRIPGGGHQKISEKKVRS